MAKRSCRCHTRYDLRNRVTQVADSLGVISQTTYDNAGRRLTQTDGNGNTVSFTYDNAGRVTATTDALGHASTTTYDNAGNVLTTTDREGNVTTHTYDALNRRVATTDALGNITSYAFNAVGNLTAITDGRGNVTSYTYDNLNRRITETYPDAAPNTKSFTYDAVGNVLTKTDQKGQVQTHVYDDLYRLLSRSTPGWPADTFSYDIGGRILTATRAGWVVTYTYDAANRVSQSTQGTQSIGYSYNIPAGTRTITYPSGRVITEQSDLRGRLAVVKEGAVNIATYSYDNGNRVDTRTYQNGVVADYTYDANNRITSLEHSRASVSLAAFAHTYDNEGNKLYEEQQHNPTRSESYAYDSIYRLVDYKVGPLVAGTVPVPVTQTTYSLDAVGNWDSKTTDAVTENRTHNAANEITQIDTQDIAHDNNGNLIEDANFNYTFDENNRLIQVVSPQLVVISQYSYDALGRRISKTVGPVVTVFYYDNTRIIESQENGGSGSVTTYTYGNYIDEVLTATRPSPLGTLYYHQNTLWSVHALTDAAGAVVERYTYDAYGAITVLDPSFLPLTSSPLAYFTFTGREYDAETGLYHYRARTYGPALGRFYSRDPLGYVDGMNLYEYVRGRAIIHTDPYGLVKWQTAEDTGFDTNPWNNLPISGDVMDVKTDANRTIKAWKPHDGRTYWCHGFTFDGHLNGPLSTWGSEVPKILNDDGWVHICCSMAARNDVVVFEKNNSIEHSGKIWIISHQAAQFDENQSMLKSKWGSGALTNLSFNVNAIRYGRYKCYTKQKDRVGCCAKKGLMEIAP